MLAMVASGAAIDGDWLMADLQTHGRGRMGRHWQSPPGNLYASHLVMLQPSDPPAPTLALVAAAALHDALKVHAADAALRIKWPNDLMVGQAKLAGILLERRDDAVVIGIGVNLAHYPELTERVVTSVAAIAGAAPAPHIFLEALAACLALWLTQWRGTGLAAIRAAWLDRAHPIGTALSAALPDGSRCDGLFEGLTDDCALRLRAVTAARTGLADGPVRVIHAGDVFQI